MKKKFEPAEIRFVKEGNGYTMYVGEVHCGWGDLQDMVQALVDDIDNNEFEDWVHFNAIKQGVEL